METILAEVTTEFAAIAEVEAVALGGSRSTGTNDHASDIDLYVYATGPVPVDRRQDIAERRGATREVDNRFFEVGDEWDERETGIHFDVMYRDLSQTKSELLRVLERHEASIGYTTCVLHNVATSRTVFDRHGEFQQLQALAQTPYPEELAAAIIRKNFPLLRDSFGAFGGQLIKAAKRGDTVSVNHRSAAFLASYFDILFAANRTTHPGEKRLLKLAAALPRVPLNMTRDVEALLRAGEPHEIAARIDSLTEELSALLSAHP